jgi:hypothetical protein
MNNKFELSIIYKTKYLIIKEYYKENDNKSYFLKITKHKNIYIKNRIVYFTELIPINEDRQIFITGCSRKEYLNEDEITHKYNINKSTINNIKDLYD